jgi:5'-3' exoribonuclease 1
MGIPSYFSYIVKNHGNIIKKIIDLDCKINNLYLDSNSIIYDCLRRIKLNNQTFSNYESKLISEVCLTIDSYVKIVKPNKTLIIAFDGVAPFAKMSQQKNRRYKSSLDATINKHLRIYRDIEWDKTAITPGTKFMKKLGLKISSYYKTKPKKLGVKNIIISDSSVVGEGEHKIFDYIRRQKEKHKNETTFIYGLDADLIMLCLNHLHISEKIYLYRETPEFIKSVDRNLEPNESYVLDIPELGKILSLTLSNTNTFSSSSNSVSHSIDRLHDYIFICFFLGNDFMPHFPAVNIRTKGIEIMINAYKNTIGNTNKILTNGNKIYWGNVRKMLRWISEEEEDLLKEEYYIRRKWEKRRYQCNTKEEKSYKFSMMPTYNRLYEEEIDPFTRNWESRYYKVLFDVDITKTIKKRICINYLEGLEWTINYYTHGCIDWKWDYRYHYPPLISDLVKYIPQWETNLLEPQPEQAVHPNVQLAYVLPKQSLYLLPKKVKDFLLKKYEDNYEFTPEIKWSFCKYFWESHVDFPHLDFEELEKNLIPFCK